MDPFIEINVNVQNEILDLVFGKLDRGEGCPRGALKIYTSGGPSKGTLLSTLYLGLPSFSKAVNGQVESYDITPDTNAAASGTASYFQLVDRDNNMIIAGSVGPSNSNHPVELDKTTITAGDTVMITSVRFSLVGAVRG